jgi:Pyridoxamine 5'-phosphate oxidase
MGKQFNSIEPAHREFIERQHIFFTASAADEGHVNVSPKDAAALRILGERCVAYVDVTGSGNETAAHLLADGRLTLMFCAFEGAPMILRLYGRGRVLPRGSAAYRELLASHFGGAERAGARQMIVLDVDRVQTSCGYGVPLFDYVEERQTLTRWAASKGDAGLEEYRRLKNSVSIDGLPTGLVEEAPVA